MDAKTLKLHLLGRPLIEEHGEPIAGFVSEKTLALLGYLAVQRGSQARERLAGLFWGDMTAARAKANLRMAIYNLQQLLPGYLQVTRLSVAFNHELNYWLDVEQLEILLADGPPSLPHPIEQLNLVLSLYRGEFMEGIYLSDSPEIDEWLLVERERLRQLALEGLQRYASGLMEAGQYLQAAQVLHQLLRLEPWQESAHQQLMLALARSGDYTAALAQYEICRRLLADELGVEPMPETTRLYERIRAAHDLPFRHNLPAQPTPFIGREAELEELARLLSNPFQRLVTITGPGGSGKSRLALQAAAGFTEAFLHGVYLVPLASLASTDLLPSAVGSALGFPFAGKGESSQQLLHYLKEKELLLVLDNCEHLSGVADFVDEVLRTAPQIKILATSRQLLDLEQEWLFELSGLAYPTSQASQNWLDYSAPRLFVECARRLQKRFEPSSDEWLDILRICQFVEGFPLGIELAAACLRHYSCREIAAEIEQGLDILAASWRNVPARHRSMRAVFEHSWKLLPSKAQHTLRRLAVFRGGFTPQAANLVAGASLGTLHTLVNRSLLRWTASPEGPKRFDLHELLRQYAYERLVEAGDEHTVRTRHLDFFLKLAETARPGLDGGEAQTWLERLEGELDNFRNALDWSLLDGERIWAGLRLATALAEFWGRRGYLSEGHNRLEALLASVELDIKANDQLQESIRARGLCALGDMAYLQGSLAEARSRFEAGLRLSQTLREQAIMADALLGLGATAWAQADYSYAQVCCEQCLHLYRAFGDEHGSAVALRRLGAVFRIQGQYAPAVDCYRQSQELYRKTGDQRGIAQTLEGLGLVARLQGDLDRARSLAVESLTLRRALKDTHGISFSLINLGAVEYESGNARQASHYLEECLAIRRRLGDQVGAAAALNFLGDVALDQGDAQQALRLFEESLAQRRLLGENFGIYDDLRGLGKAYLQLDDFDRARRHLEEGLALARELGVPSFIAATLRDLGGLYLKMGDIKQSLELVRESLSLSNQHSDLHGVVESLEIMADAAVNRGQPGLAARLLGSSSSLRESTGLGQPPREQSAAKQRKEKIQTCLGQAQFDHAWGEGYHLPTEQAIKQAMEAAI